MNFILATGKDIGVKNVIADIVRRARPFILFVLRAAVIVKGIFDALVYAVAHRQLYIGNSVHYRKVNNSYKEKSRRRKDRDEWTTIPDTHEAIISKDDFAKVQELITQRRRSRKEGTPQIFAGLVYCSDCGWSMSYGVNKSVKNPFNYCSCTQSRRFAGSLSSWQSAPFRRSGFA